MNGFRVCVLCGLSAVAVNSMADLRQMSDKELERTVAQLELLDVINQDDLDFQTEGSDLVIDMDVQADIDSLVLFNEEGVSLDGESNGDGVIALTGIHIGSSKTPITVAQVASNQPFNEDDLAFIHGIRVQTDPQLGTLVTINRIGDTLGNGVDVIVNDISLGQNSSSGTALLLEDVSNFVSDDAVSRLNKTFNLQLSNQQDAFHSQGGSYQPITAQIVPLSGDIPGVRYDYEFLIRIEKVALVRNGSELGMKGLMIYQGLDTNGDGVEDTIGPATLKNYTMQLEPLTLPNGEVVQAMHYTNIDLHADISIESIYTGNPETGSFGSFLINNLDTHNSQQWVYAR